MLVAGAVLAAGIALVVNQPGESLAAPLQSDTLKEGGDWILQRKFEPYRISNHIDDRYHYSAFYCSQAMFQLGDRYWHQFFPPLLKVLTEAQHADGSWDPDTQRDDESYGNVYTTALTVLALSAPYQILPIYQR